MPGIGPTTELQPIVRVARAVRGSGGAKALPTIIDLSNSIIPEGETVQEWRVWPDHKNKPGESLSSGEDDTFTYKYINSSEFLEEDYIIRAQITLTNQDVKHVDVDTKIPVGHDLNAAYYRIPKDVIENTESGNVL